MSARGRFWVLAAGLVLLNIAGWFVYGRRATTQPLPSQQAETRATKGELRIDDVTPAVDLDLHDYLDVRFDQDVVSADAVGSVLDTEPFTMEPPLAGLWKWETTRTLRLEFRKRAKSGTKYILAANSTTDSVLGAELRGEDRWSLSGSPVALEEAIVTSTSTSQILLKLTFTQPVRLNDIKDLLTVVRDDRYVVRYSILESSPSTTIRLILDASPPQALKVILKKGFRGAGSEVALIEDVWSDTINVDSQFAFYAPRTVHVPSLDEAVKFKLRSTQSLEVDQPLPRIRVTPPVDALAVELSEDEVTLQGAFIPGRQYRVFVPPTVRSAKGKLLDREASFDVRIPNRSSALEFSSSATVLSPNGSMMLDMNVCNATTIGVAAARLYANNIVPYLNGASLNHLLGKVSEHDFPVTTAPNRPTPIVLDLSKMLDRKPGVYSISARIGGGSQQRNNYDSSTSDRTLVLISDLGIAVRFGDDGLLAWITSLTSGRPLKDVRLRVVSRTNQLLFEATTDKDGLARVPVQGGRDLLATAFLIAEDREDLSFLDLSTGTALSPQSGDGDDEDLGQMLQRRAPVRGDLDAFLYTERGIYRPGETVQLSGVIRHVDGSVPQALPLAFRVTRAGSTFRPFPDTILAAGATRHGMFHVPLSLPETLSPGTYRIAVSLPASDIQIGDAVLIVSQFVPARIAFRASMPGERFFPGESIKVDCDAAYYFGAAAGGLRSSLTGAFKATQYSSTAFPSFVFGDPADQTEVRLPKSNDQTTGPDGSAQFSIIPPLDKPGKWWKLTASASVTEPGGRTVSRTTTSYVDTIGRHVGLRAIDSVVKPGEDFPIDWVIVEGDDTPASPSALTFNVVRVDESYNYELKGRRWVWNRTEKEVIESSVRVAANEPTGRVLLRTARSARYRVRVVDDGTTPEDRGSTSVISVFSSRDGDEQPMAGNEPDRLDLLLDRKAYAPGGTATLSIRTPFAGTLFLTVESTRVLLSRIVEVSGNSANVEVPIDPSWRGSAVINCLLVRSVNSSRSKWEPPAARGSVELLLDHTSQRLVTKLSVPNMVRPGEAFNVDVLVERHGSGAEDRSKGEGMAHVWAVDEGILALTSHSTPDPYKHFLGQKSATVASSDLYDDLLPDFLRPDTIAKIGAGDDSDDVVRMQSSPIAQQQRTSVVLFSQSVALDPSGKASVQFSVPQFSGKIRVMTVVTWDDHYGSASADVLSQAPIVIEAPAPRFLAPDDQCVILAKIFNNTDHPVDLRLQALVSGDASGEIEGDPLVNVPARSTAVRSLRVAALGMGRAAITLVATAESDPSSVVASVSLDMPIRPGVAAQRRLAVARVEPGQFYNLAVPPGLIPQFTHSRLTVGSRKRAQLVALADDLLKHPPMDEYTAAPFLAAAVRLAAVIKPDDPVRANLLQEAAARARDLCWPMALKATQSTDDAEYESQAKARALIALVDAKKSGMPVDEDLIENLVTAARNTVDAATIRDDHRAMICASLSAAGSTPESWMNVLTDRVDQATAEGRAALADAWLRHGQPRVASRVMLAGGADVDPGASTGTLAAFAKMLILLDSTHPGIPSLLERLTSLLESGSYLSSVERVMVVEALVADAVLAPMQRPYEGRVNFRGASVPFDDLNSLSLEIDPADYPVTITNDGPGDCYVAVVSEGLAKPEAITQMDQGLMVRRELMSVDGKPLDLSSLQVGDLLRVRLTFRTRADDPSGVEREGSSDEETIAIIDLLPAGIEVESAVLATSVPDAAVPDVFDSLGKGTLALGARSTFLDDRVVVVAQTSEKPRYVSYLLRVTAEGEYRVPPLQAMSVRGTDRLSISEGTLIRIKPWSQDEE